MLQEVPKSGARHSSLVNFLSASISEYVPKISCKLSEDILSCIAAVYCKLSSMQPQDTECMTSPSPSVSSSSTFSPRRRNDSWSPRYNFDSPRQYGFEKDRSEQNIGMIVVPRIRIDADKFDYASKMLETIRYATEIRKTVKFSFQLFITDQDRRFNNEKTLQVMIYIFIHAVFQVPDTAP